MSESRRPDHNEVIKSEIKLFSAQKYREDAELGAFFISFTKGEGGGWWWYRMVFPLKSCHK